jgi:hypothetical protein
MLTKCTVQAAKSSVKNLVHIYIYVKFLALLGAPYIYIYGISRLRVNRLYMFQALLAYHVEVLYVQQLVYFVCIMSAGS